MREDVCRHYTDHPYPNVALEAPGIRHPSEYFVHSAAGALFRLHHSLPRGQLSLLDAGCGTGVSSVEILLANPGCKLVGIDVSEASIEIARRRCAVKGLTNADFRVLPIEEAASLDMSFDYIECDDTLYLLDRPAQGLAALRSVLADGGVLRVNVHNQHVRSDYLRAQRLLRALGIGELASPVALTEVRRLFAALVNDNELKRRTWQSPSPSDRAILANHLIVGDRGFTFQEANELLEGASLECIDVLDAHAWDWRSAFKQSGEDAIKYTEKIAEMPRSGQLEIAELVQYRGRLFDMYTCKRGELQEVLPMGRWSSARWLASIVAVHPGLSLAGARVSAVRELRRGCPFNLAPFLGERLPDIWLSGSILELFVLMSEKAWPFSELVAEWERLRPVHVDSRERKSHGAVEAELRDLIASLSRLNVALVESGQARSNVAPD